MMMKPQRAVTAIALTSLLIAPTGWADNSDQAPPKLQMGARNGGDGAQFYGEATEQIPQEGGTGARCTTISGAPGRDGIGTLDVGRETPPKMHRQRRRTP